mgnify:CR=1 FL=1
MDQINASDSINQTILDHLKDDELVVADMTGHNPNAFYEMGYRSALNKPIIHLRYAQEDIPFDVSSIRAFDYDLSEVAIIGDQLYKDILGGNRVGIKTILVNPMSKDDMILTKLIFRPLEKNVYKKLAHKKLLIRGKYYE